MKYPFAIHDVLLPAFNAEPIIERLTARVVWSMRASKSVLAHARKIYYRINLSSFTGIEKRGLVTHRDHLRARDVSGLLVEFITVLSGVGALVKGRRSFLRGRGSLWLLHLLLLQWRTVG